MKNLYLKSLAIAVIVVFVLSSVPLGKAQSESQGYTSSFLLLNHPDGDLTYELNITVPQILYQYYSMQSHALNFDSDFSKFVTTNDLKPVADSLWQIYNNTEDFTNGVLMLVHQITYREVVPGRYPAETLVAGYGDCDLFSYIAASILEAGGIPVVLLHYKTQKHMEIGVDLGSAPTEARVDVHYVNVQNNSYYIAECTGNQWRTGWRVGEMPSEYQNATSNVVSLENIAQYSVGQVSVNIRELDHSTLGMQISPSFMLENNNVTISGQIHPQTANENVTLQAKIYGDGWTTIGSVLTQADGRFQYSWVPQTFGVIAVHASWQGNRQLNGAVSAQTSVTVLPFYVVALIVALMLAIIIFALVFIRTKRRKQKPTQSIANSTETVPSPINPT